MDAVNQYIHFSSANMSLHPLTICSMSVWSKDFCVEKLFSFRCSFACLNKGPEFPHLISPQKEGAPTQYTQTSSGKITAKQQKSAFFSHKREFSLTLCCWKTHLVHGKKMEALHLKAWFLEVFIMQRNKLVAFLSVFYSRAIAVGGACIRWPTEQLYQTQTFLGKSVQSASQAWSHSHSHMFRASTVGLKR